MSEVLDQSTLRESIVLDSFVSLPDDPDSFLEVCVSTSFDFLPLILDEVPKASETRRDRIAGTKDFARARYAEIMLDFQSPV